MIIAAVIISVTLGIFRFDHGDEVALIFGSPRVTVTVGAIL
jgi:hypothetical protein